VDKVNKGGRPSKLDMITEEKLEVIKKLASDGATQDEVALHLGVSSRTLRRWLKKGLEELRSFNQPKKSINLKLLIAIVMGQELIYSRKNQKWDLFRSVLLAENRAKAKKIDAEGGQNPKPTND